MKSVSVVLNGFKRQSSLAEQIESLKNQSYPIEKIFYFNLKSEDPAFAPDYELLKRERIEYADTSHDYGVWGRFTFALNANTDFVCILDDDTIPGKRYIENCVTSYDKQPGIYGTLGSVMRFRGLEARTYGWKENRNDVATRVNYLYQTWFMPREALYAFWSKMVPDSLTRNRHCGEDIHISLMAKKVLGLNTYVVPHPENDTEMWGNVTGEKYGIDEFAVHLSPEMQEAMSSYLYQAAMDGLTIIGSPYYNLLFFLNRIVPKFIFGEARTRWLHSISPFVKR